MTASLVNPSFSGASSHASNAVSRSANVHLGPGQLGDYACEFIIVLGAASNAKKADWPT
jgi:hypothetical protein